MAFVRPSRLLLGLGCVALSPAVTAGQGPDQPVIASAPLAIERCRLMKDGKPFRGIGVNYLSLLTRSYTDPQDRSGLAGLHALAARGIPLVRFAVLPTEQRDLRRVVAAPDEAIAAMDKIVHLAEAEGIGLIPSMFFEFRALPRIFGETVAAWGDPASRTRHAADELARRFATRFRGSRAIWMWEFTNEANDWPDQPDAYRYYAAGTAQGYSARDNYTSADLDGAFAAFRAAIQAGNPKRLVEPGYNVPRNGAWNRRTGRTGRDTVAQFYEGVALQYRSADMVSIHLYPAGVEASYSRRFADRPVATAEAFLPYAATAAQKACKPLFVGEFGPDPVSGGASGDPQEARFASMLKAIIDNDVPLAAMWVYDYTASRGYNATWDNALSGRLDAIRAANIHLSQTR